MADSAPRSFPEFLEAGLARGGFETDDVLVALLPLLKQVLAAHNAGWVAPLEGLQDLVVSAQGEVRFAPARVASPEQNQTRVDALQSPLQSAVDVVAETRVTTEVGDGAMAVSDLRSEVDARAIVRPVFLPGYRSWEGAIGHHDALTDVFSLGMLLGSLACGLDFRRPEDLAVFTANRTNLFAVNRRLNPVLASVIVQMTELDRHRRAPDLGQMVLRLETYREQATDLDLGRLDGFAASGVGGKRRLIQAHLRDRLFDLSHRNRLLHFRATAQMLNLTLASVPVLLDHRNIRLEQLFVWQPQLAATITEGAPMALGKYLRFEDAPYIPAVLDKIISEARRDRADYGFAQLRLVLCFLRWHNLKEVPEERIHSPLLLLPVDLSKKKGVRDSYVLDPATSEAEVNPALRQYLKELYDLRLPEVVDLKETTLEAFYELLRGQIQASEPGVVLHRVDRPRIELIHENARQRVDQYRRRLKLREVRPATRARPDYTYDRAGFRPLGLELFLEKVRPSPLPLRQVAGAAPESRLPHWVEPEPTDAGGPGLAKERELYAVREGEGQNPYAWEYDLCSLTLGNFNYRKMTLVRDYAKLLETDLASRAFDGIFSLAPKPAEPAPPPPLPLAEQHWVLPCDAAQASAIARARAGTSYIIQGPPGTGKSQTITNLIADYVARGKRVLFVCEKRAAIDVVFHRLRQQGLDELCCLIHDSQTDKKSFILNLKQTYETWRGQPDGEADAAPARAAVLQGITRELAELERFSQGMQRVPAQAGLPLRALVHRLVAIRGRARDLPPETEELLPPYALWLAHGEVIERLRSALADLGEELCFARHPLRLLAKDVIQAERPLEALARQVEAAEDLVDGIQNAFELSGLPGDLWDELAEIRALLSFLGDARFLAERNLLGVLVPGPVATAFEALAGEVVSGARALEAARERTRAWRDPLAPDDARNALTLAERFEGSLLRFLQPAFWRLRRVLHARYDFAQHSVAPTWSKVLRDLVAHQEAQTALETVQARAREAWRTDDAAAFGDRVRALRTDVRLTHRSVRALMPQWLDPQEGRALVESLVGIRADFERLESTMRTLLAEPELRGLPELLQVLAELRAQAGTLAEVGPVLAELMDLPDPLVHALRRAPVPLPEFEGAVAHRTLHAAYREDRAMARFDGRQLARHLARLGRDHEAWLSLNARCLRAAVRRKFREHVDVSSLPAAQLTPDQKEFKKSYAAGRRELEHEFGKTMRYKSIRDLAAGDTGRVIQDLKPIWLMSPLSVSDTLPLDPELFDVVIFDEASQIPLEEAIPAIYRSHQVIVVGDAMQLPPTAFFSSARDEADSVVVEEEGEQVEVDLDADSFLTQSAQNLPSTLLAWHYRSRSEALISFSNAAFYSGGLCTIPDRHRPRAGESELRVTGPEQGAANADALLARSISYHFLEHSPYDDRVNPGEAAYIAELIRELLRRGTGLSLGVVAFSEAQQSEVEAALARLAEQDPDFAARLEAEYVREENDVFCGLFVKNLENVQGDERDVILLSVCYGPDAGGRMLMNFGPINQRGGEKRLNVIFSRAKHHMAIVTSIRHHQITNDYNDGANSLKQFLRYAEAVSCGDAAAARRVLENLNPLSRKALAAPGRHDVVVEQLAAALRARGWVADLQVGQSRFRCDLGVRRESESVYQLGLLVDTDAHYANPDLLDRYLMQPSVLRAFGWRVAIVLSKDWYQDPDDVVARLLRLLESGEPDPAEALDGGPASTEVEPTAGAGMAGEIAPVGGAPGAEPTRGSPVPPPVPPPLTAAGAPDAAPFRSGPLGATGAGAVPSDRRYFEFVGGGSRKFWEITIQGAAFAVRFGRIGTAGQAQTKTFGDADRARHAAEALIGEKLRKGYVERH